VAASVVRSDCAFTARRGCSRFTFFRRHRLPASTSEPGTRRGLPVRSLVRERHAAPGRMLLTDRTRS